MTEIHPDILNIWYSTAEKIIEYEPEATLWDLFKYMMLWEHGEDIDKVVEENLIICEDCEKERELRAKNRCDPCYQRLRRRERKNEIK